MNKRIPMTFTSALLALTLTGCAATNLTATSAGATTAESSAAATTTTPVAAGSTAEEVLAANAEVHSADLDYDESAVVDITLTGQTATASSDAVTVDGGTVSITAPGTYRLKGTLTDGQVVVNSSAAGAVQLILAGADITSSTTAAISIADADEAVVVLADGTTNSLTDAKEYVYPDADTDEPNAALFSTADLTIGGTGSLEVTGNANDGIASKDGLVIASGSVTVKAADDGIRGKDYVVVQGGSITVDAGGDGVKSDNDEDAAKGFIVIKGGTVEVTSGDDGLAATTDAVVTGGNVTVTAGKGAAATAQDASAKGIVADAAVVLADGTVKVDAADDAVHSNGIITVSGGDVTLSAGDDGVHADTAVNITGGQLEVAQSYEGIESNDVTISGGDVEVTASDDGINLAGGNDSSAQAGPGDQQADFGGDPGSRPARDGSGGGGGGGMDQAGDQLLTISGGQVVVDSGGDGLDSNGSAVMTGGTVVVNGPTGNGNGAIDVNGTFDISGGTLLAAGSAGMAETPDADSEQAWVAATFASGQDEGAVFAIVADGKVLATFTASKAIQSIVYSSADLVAGQSVDVLVGATASGDSIGGMTASGSTSGATKAGSVTASGAGS